MARTTSLSLNDEELSLLQAALKIAAEDGSLNGAPETEAEGERVARVIEKLVKKIRAARQRVPS